VPPAIVASNSNVAGATPSAAFELISTVRGSVGCSRSVAALVDPP